MRYTAPATLTAVNATADDDDERGETERRRRDVHERPDMDPEHRGDARAAPVLDEPRHDVEHGGARYEEERERRERRRAPMAGGSGITRSAPRPGAGPSSVRNGSTRSIVRECGATRSARPPVAMARASTPSSPRMRPTMPSTWPAKP